jgi:uncharacterized protein YndB with AHSA1/START domain
MNSREVATFRIERSFAAPPEDVFDLRVGGRYVLRMRDDSGELHVVGGEYREVDRPRRLVYTWRWEGDGGPHPGHISIVTVEFRADGDLTTVVLEHSALASEESRTRHGAGWQAVLERLAQLTFEQRDGG